MQNLLFLLFAFLALVQVNLAAAPTNSWTKPTSGNWEEPFWSLGVLPSISQGEIEFRNPGFKALAIAPSTTAIFSRFIIHSKPDRGCARRIGEPTPAELRRCE
jgi:hypothetical protein